MILELNSTHDSTHDEISSSLLSPSSLGIVVLRLPTAYNLIRKRQQVLIDTCRLLSRKAGEKEMTELKENGLISDVPKSNTSAVTSAACQERLLRGSHKSGDPSSVYDEEVDDEKGQGIRDAVHSLSLVLYDVISNVCKSCDNALGLTSSEKSLSSVLARSESAKARMIYYHALDNDNVEKVEMENVKNKDLPGEKEDSGLDISTIGNWQAWHYDYGLFTALISPQLLEDESEVEEEERRVEEIDSENINRGGLLVLSRENDKTKIVRIRIPRDSVAIQVGEAASILTGGRLKPCLHCVTRPNSLFKQMVINSININGKGNDSTRIRHKHTRQTFVLFAQPPWSQKMQALDDSLVNEIDKGRYEDKKDGRDDDRIKRDVSLLESLLVPPLSQRFSSGMTFSDFAAKTTKAYYGKKTGKQV